MMSVNTLPSYPIFNGENYDFWAIKMKGYLQAIDLWDTVESGFTQRDTSTMEEAEMKEYKEKELKHFKALSFLHTAVFETIFPRIMTCKTAKEVGTSWQKNSMVAIR
jgi:hypothetical protein